MISPRDSPRDYENRPKHQESHQDGIHDLEKRAQRSTGIVCTVHTLLSAWHLGRCVWVVCALPGTEHLNKTNASSLHGRVSAFLIRVSVGHTLSDTTGSATSPRIFKHLALHVVGTLPAPTYTLKIKVCPHNTQRCLLKYYTNTVLYLWLTWWNTGSFHCKYTFHVKQKIKKWMRLRSIEASTVLACIHTYVHTCTKYTEYKTER